MTFRLFPGAFIIIRQHFGDVGKGFLGASLYIGCIEHRWWNLVRTGRAIPVMNAFFARNNVKNGAEIVTVKGYQLLSPVPQAQIDVNPSVIKQNSGY